MTTSRLHRRVVAALVMAALWPTLKTLEAWAWWLEREERKQR